MKIGLMSFAHTHSLSYLRALKALAGVEVLAADPDHQARPTGETGGEELATALGVNYAKSYAELLDWRPDGVVICSENAKHRELVELAAGARVNVLCEKPIATSLPDARAMIGACQAAGVTLMIAYPVRFSPAFAGLKAAYDAGSLGSVAAVTGTNTGRLPMNSRAWFVDPQLAGGGSLMDHTVHIADLLDCLFAGSRPVSVYATANRVLHGELTAVETGGMVSLEYRVAPIGDAIIPPDPTTSANRSMGMDAGLVSATIDCSWSKPESYPTWGGLTLQLVGTKAIADMDAFGSRVDGQSKTSGNAIWLPYGPDLDALLIEEFVGAIAEGRTPQPDGEVGYRTLEIVMAAYESVRTGQPVADSPLSQTVP